MIFWSFMLVTDLLIPLIMIGFGRYFMSHAPDEINMFFGYRTKKSIKNRDTWEFAHHYFGRLWFIGGVILLPVSIIFMVFFIGKELDTVGTAGGILCMVQCVPMIAAVVPTEKALKKNFDEFGLRK